MDDMVNRVDVVDREIERQPCQYVNTGNYDEGRQFGIFPSRKKDVAQRACRCTGLPIALRLGGNRETDRLRSPSRRCGNASRLASPSRWDMPVVGTIANNVNGLTAAH